MTVVDEVGINMLIFTAFLLVILVLIIKLVLKLWHTNCSSKVCLVGKTALVTGGNSGIGYQIVLGLAQRGCRVIIADKNEDDHLLDNVYEETQSKNVVFKHVDLSSFKSVRQLAQDIIRQEEKLDILINNAGLARTVSEVTEDGLDMTMQVNYFSAVLLTRLLEDLMKKDGGRIIFTSSNLSYLHKFTLEGLKMKEAVPSDAYWYPHSKLCLIIASDIFAERLKQFGVTSNSYHPGAVKTNIFQDCLQQKEQGGFNWVVAKVLQYGAFIIGKTAEEGAQTAIHLACSNEVKHITGEFFYEAKPTVKPKLTRDKTVCEAVWKATEEIVKLKGD